MLRILHTADVHIGVETYGRIDPATGLSTRLGDFLAALDEAVEYALTNDVHLFLFCGDAYKSRDPSQTHQREFAKRIHRLASAGPSGGRTGMPVLLLVGNHDLPNALGRATAVEIFDTLSVANVTVAARPGTYRLQTKGGPVQIVALPWPRRSALLALPGEGLAQENTRGLSFQEVNRRLEERLTEIIAEEAAALDPAVPAILAAHVGVADALTGSERAMMMGQDHVLLRSTVANPAFDYVALGHMHRHQVVKEWPPAVYPGSLQRVDFGEEGEEKGFCVVEIDPSKPKGERASWRFQQVMARPFVTIRVRVLQPKDGSEGSDPTKTVVRAIEKRHADIRDAIVRVHIETTAEAGPLLQEVEIRRTLKDAHTIAAITREIKGERSPRRPGIAAEGLTPLEALRLYLEAKGTSPQRTQTLLEYAQGLLSATP